jgi:glycosyltransferase involved in cell wall biosynthesis
MKPTSKVVMLVKNDLTRDARVRREATALAVAGFKVTVVCLHTEGLPAVEHIHGYEIRRVAVPEFFKRTRPCTPDATASLSAAGIKPNDPVRPIRNFLWSLRQRLLFLREVLRCKADIVHAHDGDCILDGFLAARAVRAAFVYDSHEFFSSLAPSGKDIHSVAVRWWWRQLERLAMRSSDAVIGVTAPILDRMTELHGKTKRVLLRNFPAATVCKRTGILRRNLGVSSGAPLAIMQGQVTRGCGYDMLVRAATLLDDNWRVVILGPGPELDSVKALAAQLSLHGKVLFHPAVPSTELWLYTADADVGMVLTQPIDESHRLALPNKLFEYMMAGVSVVASDLPAIAEVVRDSGCGVTVDPYDPAAIAKAIEALAPGTDAAKRAAALGLEAAHTRYNWENEKGALINLYAELASPRGGCDDQ